MNENLELIFLAHPVSKIMFSFRYTSSVCKHKTTILSYRKDHKIKLQILVHVFTKY